MPSAGELGVAAVKARNYAEALTHLDRAIAESPSPTWLIARSQANQQLKNHEAALRDAELAYHTAAERGSGKSREQMADAQYRRAVALLKMKRYADADCCAKWSQLLLEGRPAKEDDGVEKQVDENGFYTLTEADAKADIAGQPMQSKGAPSKPTSMAWNKAYVWRSQALGMMDRLPADDPGRKITVTKIPPRPTLETKKEEKKAEKPAVVAAEKKVEKPMPEPGSVPDEKLKLRADFYQSNTAVTISLFVKDVNKDALRVIFQEKAVVLHPLPREAAPYVKPGDRESYSTLQLGGEIVPGSSKYTVTPRKIELVLQKAVPGVKWATWGTEVLGLHMEDNQATTEQLITANTQPPPSSKPQPEPQSTPAYPTSSKSGPKNWDTIAAGEEAADDDGKDVNAFFKSLYAGGTPEQQRAMMKSFTESNGTSLSTDWDDVGKRTVETVPPEGVVPTKWTT
jgi:suppressor of G2 allele of SKP1